MAKTNTPSTNEKVKVFMLGGLDEDGKNWINFSTSPTILKTICKNMQKCVKAKSLPPVFTSQVQGQG